MKIETKIEFKDYLDWNIQLILRKPIVFISPVIILILVFFNINEFNFYLYLIVLAGILIWAPFKIFHKIKKDFYSNPTLQESITYNFSSDKIQIFGETFESEFSWSTINRIIETKNWFTIYQSSNIANLIPKKNFTQQQIIELRNIITQNNVKSRLRKD